MTPLPRDRAPADAPVMEDRLQRDYRPALLRYLARRDEQARHAGYVLGRVAVTRGASTVDLVAAHHAVLIEVLRDARDPEELLALSGAAAEFLTEVLATAAMTSQAFLTLRAQLDEALAENALLRQRLEHRGGPPLR